MRSCVLIDRLPARARTAAETHLVGANLDACGSVAQQDKGGAGTALPDRDDLQNHALADIQLSTPAGEQQGPAILGGLLVGFRVFLAPPENERWCPGKHNPLARLMPSSSIMTIGRLLPVRSDSSRKVRISKAGRDTPEPYFRHAACPARRKQVRAIRTCTTNTVGIGAVEMIMTKLNTQAVSAIHAEERRRFLASGEEPVAKQQAYILRDLIHKHCGIKLSGGDVTDCFALIYHGMDWAALMANQRGQAAGAYYAASSRDVVHQQARTLRRLTGATHVSPVRPLLDMPMSAYQQARTMAGARLCTLLAGAPSWKLYDASTSASDEIVLIYDAETDKGYIPRHFNSDPMDNSERVVSVDPVTRDEVIIPVERIRYVRLARPEGEGKTDYVLSEHTRTPATAAAFHASAVSYELARRWFNAGNDLFVMVFHAGTKTVRTTLSEWTADGEARKFDQAMSVLREQYPGCNVVFTPHGVEAVRDPAERWGASFTHVKALLPEVEAADRRYQSVLDSLGKESYVDADKAIRTAARDYNEVLTRALEAFWLDTREINGRETIMQAYGTQDPENQLAIATVGPLQKLREMIGQDAMGNPRTPDIRAVDINSAEIMRRRIGDPV